MSEHNQIKIPTQELAFADYMERLSRYRSNRIGVRVNLSLLNLAYRRDDYIRIAITTFANNVKPFEGHLFILSNNDIIFVAKDITKTMLDAVVGRLRVLFINDPLMHSNDEDIHFCDWYNIETDYEKLLELSYMYLKVAEQTRQTAEPANVAPKDGTLTPIRPELLAKLENTLANADLSNVVRRQTVCTLFEGQPPQTLFEEIFVSIDDLQNVATPGIDLRANRWLFQYLTQTLDRRVLHMLIRDGIRGDMPFSLNLNVATVLSQDFVRFEEVIAPQLRNRLVIEFNKIDVFSDMGSFLFARDYLRDHGFRLCLDGLTHHTLNYYSRSHLGFDLIKIYWTPDGLDSVMPETLPALRNIIMETGQARTILCRCENSQAVEVGQQLGIVMFEGRHVERLLSSSRITSPLTTASSVRPLIVSR